MAALLAQRGTQAWLEALAEAQVPAGPINDLAQVYDDPQVRHRKLRMELPHASAGSAPAVRNPVFYSRTPVEYGRSAPLLGEHTDEVLAERLGLDAAALAGLRSRGVIA